MLGKEKYIVLFRSGLEYPWLISNGPPEDIEKAKKRASNLADNDDEIYVCEIIPKLKLQKPRVKFKEVNS